MIEAFDLARLARIGLAPQMIQHLATLEWPSAPAAGAPAAAPGLMRITELQRDALTLHDGDREHVARALPALLNRLVAEDDGLAVGDWVLAERNEHGQWWVAERLPPLTQIARRLHDGRDKVSRAVIVANVDTALLVMGLDHDFNLRRLERYLALVRLAGVSAVVVLTKADLCPDPEGRRRAVQALLPADTAAVCVNALTNDPRQQLAPWLTPGSTLVLLGSSGTGKSTVTNALLGDAVQDTGGTRKGDGRGRHTTTARSLHVTPEGACIIDTPGLRTLRLDGESGAVGAVFDDIAGLALQCRFRDCRHDGEPGCAVRGGVPPERLRSYQKLLREAERDTLSALQRKARLSEWKGRAREARAVLRAKRG